MFFVIYLISNYNRQQFFVLVEQIIFCHFKLLYREIITFMFIYVYVFIGICMENS